MLRRLLFLLVTLPAVGLALGTDAPRPAQADNEALPKPTGEGLAGLRRLMKLGVEGGAVSFLPETKAGRSRVVLKDGDRLRRLLREQRDQLTQALCDTLLTTSRKMDQSVLLQAVAEWKDDPLLLAHAALARGESLEEQGDFPGAAHRFADAARRFAALEFPSWQAGALGAWAGVLNQQREHDAARDHYAEALRLLEKTHGPNHLDVAQCRINLGDTAEAASRPKEAIEHFEKALGILTRLPEEPAEALLSVHQHLGGLLLDGGDVDGGLRHLEESLRFAKKVPEESGRAVTVARALANLGTAYSKLRRFEQAREQYRQSVELLERQFQGPHDMLADILDNLGTLHFEEGDEKECAAALLRSLRMRLDLHGERSWAVVASHRQLGTARQHFGAYESSRESFGNMRRIAELLGGPRHPLVGDALDGLASVALEQGDYRQAEELALGALAIREEHAATRPEELADCRNRLGQIHHKLGQDVRAADDFRAALRLWERLHGPKHPSVASAWQNLGLSLVALKQFDPAAEALGKALEIREHAEPRDDEDLAHSLNSLGSLRYDQGEYGRALDLHRRARELLKDRPRTAAVLLAATLSNVGMSQFGLRRWADAVATFNEALESLRVRPRVPDPAPDSPQALYGFAPEDLSPSRTTAQVLYYRGMALLHQALEAETRERWSDTRYSFLSAIVMLERLKANVLETEEGRSELGHGLSDLYPLLIGCCAHEREHFPTTPEVGAMRDDLMFRAAELSAGRAFLLTLARSRADLLGDVPPDRRRGRLELLSELRAVEAALQRAQGPSGLERDFTEVSRLMERRGDCEARLRRWKADAEKDFPGFVDWETPRPCPLADARATLAPDEVALIYVTGAATSYVIVVEPKAPDEPGADRLPVVALPGAGEIAEWVAAVLDPNQLQRHASPELAREGYQLLIAPVADRIRGKNLVIVPTGELCYLPFELLARDNDPGRDGPRYLIEDCRVRYAPSLGVLRLIRRWRERRVEPDRTLWALGDPVYEADDPRAAGRRNPIGPGRPPGDPDARERFQRLNFSGSEVEAIRRALDSAGVELRTGPEASEAAVKDASASGRLARYRYVHFATHGILGLASGRQPSLVLNLIGNDGASDALGVNDGYLQLDEIMRLKLNADMVVLSACESGRGRLHDGEGVRGLARAILHAGSRSVVCSLWKVEDRATADLMAAAYAELGAKQGRPVPVAEAVRTAKLRLLHDGWAPFYWAPFVVIGE